jgi:hypothetical protein
MVRAGGKVAHKKGDFVAQHGGHCLFNPLLEEKDHGIFCDFARELVHLLRGQ